MTTATTSIATWGNSEAIRIPKAVLMQAGLRKGDVVLIRAGEDGTLEVSRAQRPRGHRRAVPRRLTFDELFDGYDGERLDNTDTWPDAPLTDAEREAWSL